MTDRPDPTRLGSTLRLIAQTQQAEATGTIEIQRLLAWFYSTQARSGGDRSQTELPDAA